MPKIEEGESARATIESLRRVSDLLAAYVAIFPDERQPLERLRKQLDNRDLKIYDRKNMGGHLTASAILLDRQSRSILLVYHRFLKMWIQPGGHLDHCEEPLQGAFREFSEETGIKTVKLHEWHTANPVAIDMDTHFIPVNKSKAEGEHYHHDFQYLLRVDGGSPDAVVKIAEDELSQFRWISLAEIHEGDFDPRLKRVAGKIENLIL